MRYATLMAMLWCGAAASAGTIIEPVGGFWTDGVTTAEYVQVAPQPSAIEQWQAVLTIDAGSHVVADVRLFENDLYGHLVADTGIDFYDGAADLRGEFVFDVLQSNGFGLSGPFGLDPRLNGVPMVDVGQVLELGRYVLSWSAAGAVVNLNQQHTVQVAVPEPAAGLLLAAIVAILAAAYRLVPRRPRRHAAM